MKKKYKKEEIEELILEALKEQFDEMKEFNDKLEENMEHNDKVNNLFKHLGETALISLFAQKILDKLEEIK